MGGLVASSYIRRSTANRKKVKELITMGTPFLGSAKIIKVFETGDVFNNLKDFVMAEHVKDIIPNYSSAYQLIPTIRYPNTILKYNNASYNYTQSMSFLGQRVWAHNTSIIKPMLSGAATFHSGLMNYGVHASDTVPHYYISGKGLDTPKTVMYVPNEFGTIVIGYMDVESGDGTVVVNSSENGNASLSYSYKINNAEHGALPGNTTAIQYVKAILNNGFNSFRSGSVPSNTSSANNRDPEFEYDKITVVLEGADEISLADEFGNTIIEEGEGLYVQDSKGDKKLIGSVWVINYETSRKQYNFNSGEYSISLSDPGDSESLSDALVIYTESGEYKSYEEYDMTGEDSIQINIAPNKTEIFTNNDTARRQSMILPSAVWDHDRLQEYNSQLVVQ
jgi:hypothetical protein